MTAAHELFTADSSAIVQLLNRGQSGTGLGRCGLSVVLGTALLRGAGLEWYEQGDAWHRVTLERPLPHDVADDQVNGLADDIKTLLAADTSPGSGLFQPCAPLGLTTRQQAILARAARDVILDPVPPPDVHHAFP
jgi:thiopeptide-type bacteriocin biosynthesis protein